MNYDKAIEFVKHSEYAKLATHQDENPINEHDCAMLICEYCAKIETELAEARAEIERKSALIERMREALRLALPEARSTHCENTIKAALAAERGEQL